MNTRKISIAGVVAAFLLHGVAMTAEEVHYRPGYDPTMGRPAGVGEIPEDAWTDDIEGLRAAISAPAEVRFFEGFQMFVVVRNVSDTAIRATLPEEAIHPYLTPAGKPLATGGYSNNSHHNRWEIPPGHEIAVPFPVITIVRGDGVYPTHAKQKINPGTHFIACGFGGGDAWERIPGKEKSRRIIRPEGEWDGRFRLKAREIEVLDEEVELQIKPPADLGVDHGIKAVFERPKEMTGIELDLKNYQVRLVADPEAETDAHWLVDSANYSRTAYWGPISTPALKKTELPEILEARIRREILDDYKYNEGLSTMAKLASLRPPFLEMMFDLAPVMGEPKKGKREYKRDGMARRLRDRRVELRGMGLADRAEAALEIIASEELPLPDESQFQVVSANANPADAPEDGWGPENDGLQAAAAMPAEIARGAKAEVRLFIRNVSDAPIFMTVSKGGGYDYLSAGDPAGEPLEVECPYNYPRAFASAIRRIIDPGVSSTVFYQGAILNKFKLEPVAILELKTKTSIRYSRPGDEREPLEFQFGQPPPADDAVWISSIISEPGTVHLTWELHAANGTEFKKDSRIRHWPAKGGWTGILTTLPVEVVLTD